MILRMIINNYACDALSDKAFLLQMHSELATCMH